VPPADHPDNVVALSHHRARLARGRRTRRVDALFAAPDPEAAIRALPPDEFYYVVHEGGLDEALEVLHQATSEQIRTVLDFALWERDQVSLERADELLAALVEAPPARVAAWARGLDVELLSLLLRKRARIYDLSLEAPPDEPEGVPFPTPDGLFVLDLLGGDEAARVTARLMDAIYRDDRDWPRRILVGARAELDAELEELSYRWRSGRMADLGFVDFYEALEVYREIDPASVRIADGPGQRVRPHDERDGESLRVPAALAERLSGSTPFARAVAGLGDAEEVAEVHFALVALANRVLSADRVAPGDDAAVGDVLTRVSATLDLAVEFLSRGAADRGTAAVRSVPLVRLFQIGVSLVGKLRRVAVALTRRAPLSLVMPGVALFEAEDAEVLAALTRLRPRFPRRLEAPPAGGERPFASLADLALAAAALERAGAAMSLVHALGARPEGLLALLDDLPDTDRAGVDLGVLARTLLVPRLAGSGPGALRPVTDDELAAFARRQEPSGPAVRQMLAAAVPGAAGPALAAVADRWAASLAPLEPVVTRQGLSRPTTR
jgi:hypothetical protein